MPTDHTIRLGLAAAIAAALQLGAGPTPARAQTPAGMAPGGASLAEPELEYRGAPALGLALRRLGMTGRVLMVAAHPDDENTAVLATLALRDGADVAYLSLTRGEGGQNGIGPELGTGLGLIRSEELLAARRLDGPRQFFTRAIDYGYSKNAEEAFRHWPRDSVVADVVAVMRRFRPDVVVTIWSGTPRDGHGQHEAAGIVVRDAFEAAGDPSRFPDQIEAGLAPHSPAKLYQSYWRNAPDDAIEVRTGEHDPLFGRSHFQIAMDSRSRHRSQDQGRPQSPGPHPYTLSLDRARGDLPEGPSLFAGLDTTMLQRVRSSVDTPALAAALGAYDSAVAEARASFNPLSPSATVAELARAADRLARAEALLRDAASRTVDALRFHIREERRQLESALARAAGVTFDATASDARVVPGQTFEFVLSLWNGGERPVRAHALAPALPAGWRATTDDPLPATVPPGELAVRTFEVRVPDDAEPTRPYFLERRPDGDMYRWPDDVDVRGLPFAPPPIRAGADVSIADRRVGLWNAAEFVDIDPREGEHRRPVLVVPGVSVRAEPELLVLPVDAASRSTATGAESDASRSGGASGATEAADRSGPADAVAGAPGARGAERAGIGGSSARDAIPAASAAGVQPVASARAGARRARTLALTVRLSHEAPDPTSGALRFELPDGWRAEPAAVRIAFDGPGTGRVVETALHPPADVEPGEYRIRAVYETDDGRSYSRGYRVIDYPHTTPRTLYSDAATTVRAFDIAVPAGLDVAYVVGAGDAVPEALAQLGLAVDVIEPAQLAAADLAAYDVVVTGIRAYEVRPEVRAAAGRLMDFVERGGTLIVQYNKYAFFRDGSFGPYPMTVARPHDRVTDETAPVTILEPGHPVFNDPNRITDADWEGWVQERGLYFAHTWDDRYTPLLEMSDPGEDPLRGGMLITRVGEGTYVHTGLAFFRQLPAGVPGAYRLFANLIALGAER